MTPLRRRMIEDMQVRNLAPLTQTAYLQQVSRFARHFGQLPERLGREEIRAYQVHLAQDKRLAASSISVAGLPCGFSTPSPSVEADIPTCRQPGKLPNVLSQEEVGQFLDAVANLKHRVILTVCYAAGLRVSEVVRLKPAAIDSRRMVIRMEEGKRQVQQRGRHGYVIGRMLTWLQPPHQRRFDRAARRIVGTCGRTGCRARYSNAGTCAAKGCGETRECRVLGYFLAARDVRS
jgi:integrase